MSDNKTTPDRTTPDNDPWKRLRLLTDARIGLPRSGASLATGPLLDFRLAHAQARDAVRAELDTSRLAADLGGLGLPVLTVTSEAADKQTYLMRPDLGRRLSPESEVTFKPHAGGHDIVFVVIDGLSARAVQDHAAPILAALLPELSGAGWRVAPLVIVRHGRVAIGDSIANLLEANCLVVLIGERPGLSAPDSMGAYVTWQPDATTSDSNRNCISNIRPDGISYAEAAFKLAHLTHTIRARRISGVRLKDTSESLSNAGPSPEPANSGKTISRD